ncbi:hypothetical protein [Methanothermobacter wolfeii]|nr:hypothetical protein [Methanothermobacter wolfeii]MDI6703003.1 hypothetical protein [Methanothermobacter wolfeii]MDI6842657.1 hypothetical protein [Methanothermobacter wolfeii]
MATLSGLMDENTYNEDPVSAAAQMKGQDLITLSIWIPLIII